MSRRLTIVCVASLLLALTKSGHTPVQAGQLNPEATDSGLDAMVELGKDVLVVHVLKDSCLIPPSEGAPTTKCEGLILQNWKGLTDRGSISFTVASGVVRLSNDVPATFSGEPIRPFHVGGRYLLSLRYAKESEAQPATQRPWTADEVQVALEFRDTGELQPVLAVSEISGKLRGMSHQNALHELEEITHRARMADLYKSQAIEDDYCCTLSSKRLEDAGVHLPAYLPSVFAQNDYQVALSSHQELTVEWVSFPGVSDARIDEPVDEERVRGISPAPNFYLLESKGSLPGGPWRAGTMGFGHQFVFVAITSRGEIRGLATPGFDNRNCPDLPPPPGVNSTADWGKCAVFPRVQFPVKLPEDPEIKTIIILKVSSDDKGYHFRPFGRINLQTGGGAG